MNFEEFIEFCDKNCFGIVAFNSDVGLYIKGECLVDQLSKQLALMAGNIKDYVDRYVGEV